MIKRKLSLLARVRRYFAQKRVERLQQRQCEIRAEIVAARKELEILAKLQAFAERQAGML